MKIMSYFEPKFGGKQFFALRKSSNTSLRAEGVAIFVPSESEESRFEIAEPVLSVSEESVG